MPVRTIYGAARSHYRPFRDTWVTSWLSVYYKTLDSDAVLSGIIRGHRDCVAPGEVAVPRSPVSSVTRRALLGGGLAALAGLLASFGCGPRGGAKTPIPDRLSFIVLASERALWAPVVESFGKAHGVRVEMVEGPNATDLRENMYTTALLAGDDSLDVVYMDVTWTSKFAAAGWLLPLDDVFRPEELSALLPQAVDAGRYRGHLYRIPVRTDVGLLYYRRDLLEEAGIAPPRDVRGPAGAARRLQAPRGPLGLRLAGEPVRGPHVRVPGDPQRRGRLLGRPGVARSGPGPARGRGGAGVPEAIARSWTPSARRA